MSGEKSTSELAVDAGGAYPLQPTAPGDWRDVLRTHSPADGITIGCWNGRPRTNWSLQSEGPPTFCISVMLEGRLNTAFDGGPTMELQPGMVALMSTIDRASGWNAFVGGGQFRMVDIRLTPEALCELTGVKAIALKGSVSKDYSLHHRELFMGGLPASAALMQIARDILACGFMGDVARTLYLRAKAFEATALVLQGLEQRSGSSHLPSSGDLRRLLSAQSLIKQQFGHNWSIQTLARSVGLNEKKLQAGFQAISGTSVHGFLTQVRIEAATNMLERGASVTETAYTVGFSSLSHFSRVFRSFTGTTPKQWALRNFSHILSDDAADDAYLQ